MKTNKLKVLWLVLFVSAGSINAVQAQTEKEDIAIIQSVFGKTKKAVIAENIELKDNEKDGFWKLYDEYEAKIMIIGSERIKLIQNYAELYDHLNDTTASTLAINYLDNLAKYTALYKAYFPKFRKLIGGLRAATLMQLEVYMQTAVQADLQRQIPIIGALKKEQN